MGFDEPTLVLAPTAAQRFASEPAQSEESVSRTALFFSTRS